MKMEKLAILVGLHERKGYIWFCFDGVNNHIMCVCLEIVLSVGWCTWQVSAAMCCFGRLGIEGVWVVCCVLIWFSSRSSPCIDHSGILTVGILVQICECWRGLETI